MEDKPKNLEERIRQAQKNHSLSYEEISKLTKEYLAEKLPQYQTELGESYSIFYSSISHMAEKYDLRALFDPINFPQIITDSVRRIPFEYRKDFFEMIKYIGRADRMECEIFIEEFPDILNNAKDKYKFVEMGKLLVGVGEGEMGILNGEVSKYLRGLSKNPTRENAAILLEQYISDFLSVLSVRERIRIRRYSKTKFSH